MAGPQHAFLRRNCQVMQLKEKQLQRSGEIAFSKKVLHRKHVDMLEIHFRSCDMDISLSSTSGDVCRSTAKQSQL